MHTRTSPLMEKANDVKQDLRELGELAVDAAKDSAGQLRDKAVDVYEQGRDQARNVQKQAESYIKREPIKAVLIAGAVGLALGYLLSRRNSK